MAQVGRQPGQPGLDVGAFPVPPQQAADGEAMAKIVLKPISA
jgi:hypothetical protein